MAGKASAKPAPAKKAKTPHVGRPAKLPASATPAKIPGATKGSIRQRAKADEPWNPTGKATPPPKNPK